MSKAIGMPVTQKRLTNVAIVRLKRTGKRFEIACYPNKVLNWRSGAETDLDEVLQSEIVYKNVSKGVAAKAEDLEHAFGTSDQVECCKLILSRGELQEGEKERRVKYETLFRDVVTLVAEMCVNPETGLAHPASIIERALHESHFAVKPGRTAKVQALEALHALAESGVLPIERAPMRLRLSVPRMFEKEMDAELEDVGARIERREEEGVSAAVAASLEKSGNSEALGKVRDGLVVRVCCVDPSAYRELDAWIREKGRVLNASQLCSLRVEEHAVRGEFSSDGAAPQNISSGGGAITASGAVAAPGMEDMPRHVSYENKVVRPISWKERETPKDTTPVTSSSSSSSAPSAGCKTCKIDLPDRAAVRTHMRSDWHRINLKRKVAKKEPMTKDEFDTLTPEAVETLLNELQ